MGSFGHKAKKAMWGLLDRVAHTGRAELPRSYYDGLLALRHAGDAFTQAGELERAAEAADRRSAAADWGHKLATSMR